LGGGERGNRRKVGPSTQTAQVQPWNVKVERGRNSENIARGRCGAAGGDRMKSGHLRSFKVKGKQGR